MNRDNDYIGIAHKKDKEAVYQIWKDIFVSDKLYLSIIFNDLYPHLTPFVYKRENEVMSTAFALPVSIGEIKGEYIYGVATKEKARGAGLASALISHICCHFKAIGEKFLIVRPAEEQLFEYYMKQGFTLPLRRDEICMDLGETVEVPVIKTRQISQLTPSLLQKRRAAANARLYIWPKEIYKAIINLTLLDRGCTCKFRYRNNDEYIIAHADYSTPDCVIIEETSLFLGKENNLADKTIYKLLREAAIAVNERSEKIIIYAPATQRGIRFALIKPLTSSAHIIEKLQTGFFNFTLE